MLATGATLVSIAEIPLSLIAHLNIQLGLVDVRRNNITTRPAFQTLSSRLAAAHPNSTSQAVYKPPTTPLPSCHALTVVNPQSSSGAPLTTRTIGFSNFTRPSPRLCACMMATLSCVPGSDVALTQGFQAVSHICNRPGGDELCFGVRFNFISGEAGAYDSCTIEEKVAWTFDQYYQSKGRDPAACKSQGGILRDANQSEMQAPDCVTFLKQAGPQGRGVVTYTPEPVAPGGSNRLNTGAKIGIGVGIAVFLVILASTMALFCIWARRRIKERQQSQPNEAEGTSSHQERPEIQAERNESQDTERNELGGAESHREIAGHERLELETSEVVEISDVGNAYELSATPIGAPQGRMGYFPK